MVVFMNVESEFSGYRDVRERIAQLSQSEIGKSDAPALDGIFLETGTVLLLAPWSEFWDRITSRRVCRLSTR